MDLEILSLDRIPIPSLEVYAFLSFFGASCSMYYFWTESQTHYFELLASATSSNSSSSYSLLSNGTIDFNSFTWQTIHWASQQPHCVWPIVNLVYCLLILLSHCVQKSVFGNLRASEQENIKDQFWNLIFYKVVFVFGVVNVQEVEDAIGWCFFVSVIAFLQLARQLSKERHNYLILMNDWTKNGEKRRRRILGLLSFIFFSSVILFVAVIGWYMSSTPPAEDDKSYRNYDEVEEEDEEIPYDFNLGLHSAIFMLSEIGLLVIQTLHALTICIFDQVFCQYKGEGKLQEDMYSSIALSINFKFDLVALLFDLVHHVHMLVCCNLFLSMTSLIVSLQMRTRVRQIHGILKKRQSYLWLSLHIDQYPEADFVGDENCAICWDILETNKSRVLPCHHIFHTTCLRKWLLVSMNCPTCRLSLVDEKEMKKRTDRGHRRLYSSPPNGFWGFLQTGQTLLDLFGGWDPQADDVFAEVPSPPSPVPLFGDFGVQDWTVQRQAHQSQLNPSTTPEAVK